MTDSRTIQVILNPHAGDDDGGEAEIERAFAARGVRARFTRLGDPDVDVDAVAERAGREGDGVLVVTGGDGTIQGVVGVAIERDVILGIVPGGTHNHFARDLGVGDDVEEAVATILDGRVARIDVAEVNGRPFINNVSIGIYPMIVRERLRQRVPGHWPGILWATLKVIVRPHPHLHARIRLDGELLEAKTQLVLVSNNRYRLDPLSFGARDRLDEGTLGVYVSKRSNRRDLLALLARALVKRLPEAEAFEVRTARQVEIDARGRREFPLAMDGEVERIPFPLRLGIRPGALRVMVPRDPEP